MNTQHETTPADQIQVGHIIKWNNCYLSPVIMTEPRGKNMTAIYTQHCPNDIAHIRVINNTRLLTVKGK
jgi:hypothetical protein